MRQINNFEREILRRIVNYHNNGIIPNLASVIDPQLNNKDIYMDFAAGTAAIRADMQFYNQGTLVDEVRTLTLEIVTTVNLLRDLQNNGYVTLFLEAPLPNNARYGQLVVGNTYVTANINDPTVTSLLLDYSFKSILVGQPLLDFVSHDFRTEDKVNADNDSVVNRRNLMIAAVALVLSTLLSFWEIYNGTQEVKYGRLQIEQVQTVKLDSTQQQSIEHKIDDTKKILEETKTVLIGKEITEKEKKATTPTAPMKKDEVKK